MHIILLLVMTRIIFAHQVFSIIMCQGSCPLLLVGTFHPWKYDSNTLFLEIPLLTSGKWVGKPDKISKHSNSKSAYYGTIWVASR